MSPLFKLNLQDFIKGVVIAAGTAFLAVVGTSLNSGQLPDVASLKAAGIAAVAAALAYLGKNLFTNSSGQLASAESKDAPKP